MGLLNGDGNNGFYYSPYIEHYGNVDNHLLSSTDDESDSQSATNLQSPARRRQRPARSHISVSQENLSNYGRKRGVRRTRRVDNLKYLINLEEKDEDLGDNNNSPSANFEPSSTLFEKLFEDSEKMNFWNAFMESSEEDQRRVLNYRGLHDIQEEEEEGDAAYSSGGAQTAEDSWVMILDERSDHPAFTPKECYGRVDRKLKNLLKRRQLPMGMLANLERELVTFFHDCSSSVYVCDIASSYERLLLHALCQYLNLHSQSYDDNGSRKTQVENRHAQFRPPSLLLSEYLQRNQHTL
ncbi:R3H domain-containing protein 4 [Aplysia californica]|uniref:R3H domain-containing protein 4 n=1 Tax=Aplysia californica TaxID=6500 RepID=A0ABM0JDX1_APLCA|nr:R3H domain-containing protein 4 [Aplysia californica]